MRVHRLILVAAVLAASPLLSSAADKSSEAKFISQVQAAFDSRDASKLLALACWDNVEPWLKKSREQEFANLVTLAPASIQLLPPDRDQKYEYSRDGVSYRVNLPVTRLLKIEFKPGGDFNAMRAVAMPVGEKQGVFLIVMPAPVK